MLLVAYYEARTIAAVEHADENSRTSLAVVGTSLGTAGLFAALTMPAHLDPVPHL